MVNGDGIFTGVLGGPRSPEDTIVHVLGFVNPSKERVRFCPWVNVRLDPYAQSW